MRKRREYTKEEERICREMYPMHTAQEVADKLGRSISSVYNLAFKLDVKKDPEYWKLEKSGRGNLIAAGKAYRYPKGNVPVNKGKKLSKELRDKLKPTMFKKGNLPHNTKKDGAISIRKDNRGVPYYFIRIAKGKWIGLHKHLWERAHGKLKKGAVIRFKDGNTMNCVLSNLELIDKRKNMLKNSIARFPEDIQKTIRTISKLKKEINAKE